VREWRTNTEIQRRLTISVPERYGLPNATDEEVLIGLLQLTRRHNQFTERNVLFSRYDLIGFSVGLTKERVIVGSKNHWIVGWPWFSTTNELGGITNAKVG
jgi:hypothetical protein